MENTGPLLLDSGSISICKHFILLTSSSSSDITSIPPLIKQVYYISVSAINTPPAQDSSTIVTQWFYYRKEKITHVYVILVLALRKQIWEQVRKELAGGIVMRKHARIQSPWEQKGRSGSVNHSVTPPTPDTPCRCRRWRWRWKWRWCPGQVPISAPLTLVLASLGLAALPRFSGTL